MCSHDLILQCDMLGTSFRVLNQGYIILRQESPGLITSHAFRCNPGLNTSNWRIAGAKFSWKAMAGTAVRPGSSKINNVIW